MAVQNSARVRNAMNNARETTIGPSPTLVLRSGPPPANCAAADTGTVLATIPLPADWAADAANGAKTLLGTWTDTAADAAGTAGHYRIVGTGSVVDEQGTVTATGGGGDITLDNPTLAVGQQITITAYTYTQGGA